MTSTASAAPAVSIITALHARYEETYREYNLLDAANLTLGKDKHDQLLSLRYDDAKEAKDRESDALRSAILFQVPRNWTEALILQFHVYIAADLIVKGKPTDADKEAVTVAVDALFDFMCCNVDADHGRIGPQFQAAANRVFDRRRFRTGEVEA